MKEYPYISNMANSADLLLHQWYLIEPPYTGGKMRCIGRSYDTLYITRPTLDDVVEYIGIPLRTAGETPLGMLVAQHYKNSDDFVSLESTHPEELFWREAQMRSAVNEMKRTGFHYRHRGSQLEMTGNWYTEQHCLPLPQLLEGPQILVIKKDEVLHEQNPLAQLCIGKELYGAETQVEPLLDNEELNCAIHNDSIVGMLKPEYITDTVLEALAEKRVYSTMEMDLCYLLDRETYYGICQTRKDGRHIRTPLYGFQSAVLYVDEQAPFQHSVRVERSSIDTLVSVTEGQVTYPYQIQEDSWLANVGQDWPF